MSDTFLPKLIKNASFSVSPIKKFLLASIPKKKFFDYHINCLASKITHTKVFDYNF